jgi:hypothetical protein
MLDLLRLTATSVLNAHVNDAGLPLVAFLARTVHDHGDQPRSMAAMLIYIQVLPRATHRYWTHRPTTLIACLPRFVPLS